MQAAEKAQQAQALAGAFDAINNIHREGFAPATPPIAPQPSPVDESAIRKRHESKALEGIGIFKRSERTVAKEHARRTGEQEIARVRQELTAQRAEWQAALDARWNQLCANNPDVVLETLAEAFDDNEAPAAAVGIVGGEVALAVLVPNADTVPDRMSLMGWEDCLGV
ncbi:hypothetical protein [Planotetraspora mira]|uniref:Uncharacterized protein n=1 Tax=Planotetraspora mira TaxID=58121 RepID=A0A8J3TW02_9ACTN|nr:hypothetical protein [Planotetraspora mira]GII33506.1 hypothetical protein Pmi06nite_69480 [Planotetraspora mira]